MKIESRLEAYGKEDRANRSPRRDSERVLSGGGKRSPVVSYKVG